MDTLDTAERAPPLAAPARLSGWGSPDDLLFWRPGMLHGARQRAAAAPAGANHGGRTPHMGVVAAVGRGRARQWRTRAPQ